MSEQFRAGLGASEGRPGVSHVSRDYKPGCSHVSGDYNRVCSRVSGDYNRVCSLVSGDYNQVKGLGVRGLVHVFRAGLGLGQVWGVNAYG